MKNKYKNVHIESVARELPGSVTTTEELEERLSPLYQRLGLQKGRLELMTGIESRHFGAIGLRPSDLSIAAAKKALAATDVNIEEIGCIIHTSVCRDFLEPSTATVIHAELGLDNDCVVFDLSNACLGWMNGIAMVANMIELGQISVGLVVSGEDGRALVDSTIKMLNADQTLTRKTIKSSIASLTIGSGGVATVLTSKARSKTTHKLLGAVSKVETSHNDLCRGGVEASESTRHQVEMQTDSEAMLKAGVDLADQTWGQMKGLMDWREKDVDHIITHQVGKAHRSLLFDRLKLDLRKDHSTFQSLGNIGSASIGATLVSAEEKGVFNIGEKIALMGIGSGLVSMMVGIEW